MPSDKETRTAQQTQGKTGNPPAGPAATASFDGSTRRRDLEERMQERIGAMPAPIEQKVKPIGGLPTPPPLSGFEGEEKELAEAFQQSTFYYGTVGSNSPLKRFITGIRKKLTEKRKQKGQSGDQNPYYYPGIRAMAYLPHRNSDGGEHAQMMDMYYGEAGTDLHMLRNPLIGKYIHEQMKYQGEYSQDKSGRDAYRETFGKGGEEGDSTEGWKWPNEKWGREGEESARWRHPETNEALTGTMEISRLIREGIKKFGGKLVFDGKNVIHKSNFVEGTYQGDTNKEARALFPYLAEHPGASRVPFGNGILIFHWGGKEVVPTQNLFLSHWDLLLSKHITSDKEDVAGPQTSRVASSQLKEDSVFRKFPEGPALQSRDATRQIRWMALIRQLQEKGKTQIEERIVTEDTDSRINKRGKLVKYRSAKFKEGQTISIDRRDIQAESQGDIGRNNTFVRIAGTYDPPQYIRMTKLSMYLGKIDPSEETEKEDSQPEKVAKAVLSNLYLKDEFSIPKHGKKERVSMLKAEYRDKIDRGFLTEAEVSAIKTLSKTPAGKAHLRKLGFLNQEETEKWAKDPMIADLWERYREHKIYKKDAPILGDISKVKSEAVLSHLHRLQIATRQKELGLGSDQYKNTPGYIRYTASKLDEEKNDPQTVANAKKSIYQQDTEAWKKTLDFDPEKKPAGVDDESIKRTGSALAVLRRVFLILHDGLMYRKEQEQELKEKWTENAAVALSHGGRIMIQLPKLAPKEEDKGAFIDWLLGKPKEARDAAGIDTRTFSSHGVKRKKGLWEVKQNTATRVLPFVKSRTTATHFGMDLPIGGLGNTDMAGNVILPDGRHGHMYIYYDPPTLDLNGVVLIGIETSRMARTDVMGQFHDMRGAPAEFSSVGTAKKARIGDEFGGRVVDYKTRGGDWLGQLKKAEENVNAGLKASAEMARSAIDTLVGQPRQEPVDQTFAKPTTSMPISQPPAARPIGASTPISSPAKRRGRTDS